MKLIQLLYFCRACELQNITKAAEDLHVSQPSISMSIRELEEEFGLILMQRNNKGFILTREGHYFYERAAALLSQADNLEDMMCDMGNQRKRVNLGIPPMIGTYLFPKLYSGFRQQYPDIALHTRESNSEELLQLVDDRTLDFAILMTNEIPTATYQVLPISETETVFCVSKNHRLAKRRKVSISQIKDEPLIMFSKGYFQNKILAERYAQANSSLNIIHSSGQFFTIKEFISEGIAAGFMFKDIADSIPDIKGISLDDPIRIHIGMIWKANQHMFSDATRFLKYVKTYAANTKKQ